MPGLFPSPRGLRWVKLANASDLGQKPRIHIFLVSLWLRKLTGCGFAGEPVEQTGERKTSITKSSQAHTGNQNKLQSSGPVWVSLSHTGLCSTPPEKPGDYLYIPAQITASKKPSQGARVKALTFL